ncbi:MAG TPA: short chain dehydrogenase [Coleofasciculaceae cyanobacterium]|jgi:NAD(P)-dependent dehydrogenase (short-subunit alcohol dehydrogenase family)
MKVVIIGASGTIGRAVVDRLSPRHEIVKVGRKSGDVNVDITSTESITKMYEEIGSFDAVVATTGNIHFGDFSQMSEADYYIGIKDKLMGQVNLVLIGKNYINDGGSFTLTSGVVSHDPIKYGSSASMVNAAIDGFVIGAAIELTKGIRLNSVSPGVVLESMDSYGDFFRGHEPVTVARVALAFSKSVEGLLSGKVFQVL